SSEYLLCLINDLLDIAKIDAESMAFDPENFKLDLLIKEVYAFFENQYNKKGVLLEYTIATNVEFIYADRFKCKQIMINLLSNALKYTPGNGKVSIEVSLEPDNVLFKIIDSGIGIKKEYLEQIFTEFFQPDQSRDRALGGTGIGLALAKRLVEMHNGKIGVISEPENGSIFWFALPMQY
ncbi:MAG: HAMP domain-containing sensor histidine kinase, partial [Cyanobacteriota bacterium]